MSDILGFFNNIRILRARVRKINLTVLKEILEKLIVVVEERKEEEASAQNHQAVRKDKIEVLCDKLLEDGIDPAELLQSFSTIKKLNEQPIQLNTNMWMKMVTRKLGQVRDVLQK